jgi:hypothetical protein
MQLATHILRVIFLAQVPALDTYLRLRTLDRSITNYDLLPSYLILAQFGNNPLTGQYRLSRVELVAASLLEALMSSSI